MKKLILLIILVFFSKIVYSNNLFDTSFYDIEFKSNNIENDKIKELKKIKIKSLLSILKNTLSNKDYIEINNKSSKNILIITSCLYPNKISTDFESKIGNLEAS